MVAEFAEALIPELVKLLPDAAKVSALEAYTVADAEGGAPPAVPEAPAPEAPPPQPLAAPGAAHPTEPMAPRPKTGRLRSVISMSIP